MANVNESLREAARTRNGVERMTFLLSARGADADAADVNGRTALALAVLAHSTKNVEFLIKQGAAVNKTNASGFAPLHVAAQTKQLAIAQLLVDGGASRDLRTPNGQTAVDLLAASAPPELRVLLTPPATSSAGLPAMPAAVAPPPGSVRLRLPYPGLDGDTPQKLAARVQDAKFEGEGEPDAAAWEALTLTADIVADYAADSLPASDVSTLAFVTDSVPSGRLRAAAVALAAAGHPAATDDLNTAWATAASLLEARAMLGVRVTLGTTAAVRAVSLLAQTCAAVFEAPGVGAFALPPGW